MTFRESFETALEKYWDSTKFPRTGKEIAVWSAKWTLEKAAEIAAFRGGIIKDGELRLLIKEIGGDDENTNDSKS